jgi:NADPH:quinone reductase
MTHGVLVRTHGGPEVLEWSEIDVAEPGPGEIKLRQTAIGLNFVDIYQRSGLYKQTLPFIPGNEGAGEVLAVGEGVSEFRPGDRIVYSNAIGAYAEERLIPAAKAVKLPEGIDERQAAAMMLKGLTAYYLLRQTFAVKAGDTILVHAAAGGVGQIATQWAKALGARVLATVGSDEKIEIARANGCDAVINYRTEDFAERVRSLTSGEGVDVVYDGVGKATFEKSLDCLKPRGLMVSFGNASGPVSIDNLGILANKGSLFLTRPTAVHYFLKREELLNGAAELFDQVLSGNVRVDITATYPLAEAAKAQEALANRETTGSVILLP